MDQLDHARKNLKSVKLKGVYQNYRNFKMMGNGSFWKSMKEMMFNKNQRTPGQTLSFAAIDPETLFNGDAKCLKATWLGHSSFIIEIDGLRMLLDPVLSNDVSPVPWLYSVGRFQKQTPILPEELPEIDAMIISHNHYDHLDKKTIRAIHKNINHIIVPPGVEAYLLKWGVSSEKIIILDWSETCTVKNITVTALPSQHFSARGIFDRNKTLWASWKIQGPWHKFFFSGDTGYHKEFKAIGEKHGPFDLVILDTGQFNKGWPFVHMFPNQSVKAHRELKGNVYLPVHWGSFNLSLHNWFDPIEKAISIAENKKVNYAIPYPGETITIGEPLPRNKWWINFK